MRDDFVIGLLIGAVGTLIILLFSSDMVEKRRNREQQFKDDNTVYRVETDSLLKPDMKIERNNKTTYIYCFRKNSLK